MRPGFEKLPPEQQILAEERGRDAPGRQEEGEEGRRRQLQTACSSRGCAGAPRGWGLARGWALRVSCSLQSPVIFAVSPFAIQTLVILSSAAAG